MTKPRLEDDPAWSRTKQKGKRKKGKMCSRASLRLLSTLVRKKRYVDRNKGIGSARCVTRTVELPSTQAIGEESSKLLFMLAIGLNPKFDKPKTVSPVVRLERLDPVVEAEAKIRTREIIYKIFEERKKELLRKRVMEYAHPLINHQNHLHPHPQSVSPQAPSSVLKGAVECVDLVSDDEGSPQSTDDDDEPEVITDVDGIAYCHSELVHKVSMKIIPIKPPCQRRRSPSPPPEKILYCSQPWQQKKVHANAFKPLLNNQGQEIFRKWNPESIARIMNRSPSSNILESSMRSENSRSKFLSSLKSIPTATPFTVGIPSYLPRKPAGPMTSKNTFGDKPRKAEEFILPDDIITID